MSEAETPMTEAANARTSDAGAINRCNWLDRAEASTRRDPARAVVAAFGAGFLFHLLPIRAITSAVFALAQPALLVAGLVKVWESCPCKKEPTSNP